MNEPSIKKMSHDDCRRMLQTLLNMAESKIFNDEDPRGALVMWALDFAANYLELDAQLKH